MPGIEAGIGERCAHGLGPTPRPSLGPPGAERGGCVRDMKGAVDQLLPRPGAERRVAQPLGPATADGSAARARRPLRVNPLMKHSLIPDRDFFR